MDRRQPTETSRTPRLPPRLLAVLAAMVIGMLGGGSATAADSSPGLTNTICPVMEDEPVDPAFFVEHEGRRVYFCCDLCIRRFKANPGRYAAELARVMPALRPSPGAGATPAPGDAAGHDDEDAVAAATHDAGGHDTHDPAEDGHEVEAHHATVGAERSASIIDPSNEHDHSAHEPDTAANPLLRFLHWLGRFHPPAVAFPVALLAAAGVAELLFLVKKRPIFDHASRFCVWFGIAMTVAGGTLGWFFAGFHLTDPTWLLTTHRWLGTTATLWALLLIVPTVKAWGGSQNAARWRRGYRLALLAAILLVGANAFFGGAMIYGLDHYRWPF